MSISSCVQKLISMRPSLKDAYLRQGQKFTDSVEQIHNDIKTANPNLSDSAVEQMAMRQAAKQLNTQQIHRLANTVNNAKLWKQHNDFLANNKLGYVDGFTQLLQNSMNKMQDAQSIWINNNLAPMMKHFSSKPFGVDRIFGDNPAMSRHLIRALGGDRDVHPDALQFANGKKLVESDLDNILRKKGLVIPDRDNNLPHNVYNYNSVIKAGKEQFINDHMDHVNWSQIEKMKGEEFKDPSKQTKYISDIYDSLERHGAYSDLVDSPYKSGFNNYQKAMFGDLPMKDGQAWLDTHDKYGTGNIFANVTEHLQAQHRANVLFQDFGNNPNGMFRALQAEVGKNYKTTPTLMQNMPFIGDHFQNRWDVISGKTSQLAPGKLASVLDTTHSVIGNLLSSAWIVGSIPKIIPSDSVSAFQGAKLLGLNFKKIFSGSLKYMAGLTSEERVQFQRSGSTDTSWIGRDAFTPHRLSGTGFNIGSKLQNGFSTFADGMMRMSGHNRWYSGQKMGWSEQMKTKFGMSAGKSFENLDMVDRETLKHSGISSEDWDQMRQATSTKEIDGQRVGPYIDVEKMWKQDPETAIKWQGMMAETSRYSVPEVSLQSTGIQTQGLQRGQIGRIAAGTIGRFKSMAITEGRQALRGLAFDPRNTNKWGTLAQYTAGMVLSGMFIHASKSLIKGEMPDFNKTSELFSAIAESGVLMPVIDVFQTFQYAKGDKDVEKNMLEKVASFLIGPDGQLGIGTLALMHEWGTYLKSQQPKDLQEAQWYTEKYFHNYTPGVRMWWGRMMTNYANNVLRHNINPQRFYRIQRMQDREKNQ